MNAKRKTKSVPIGLKIYAVITSTVGIIFGALGVQQYLTGHNLLDDHLSAAENVADNKPVIEETAPEVKTVIVRTDANIRPTPTTANTPLGAVAAGAVVQLTGDINNGWYQVISPTDITGWIWGDLLIFPEN